MKIRHWLSVLLLTALIISGCDTPASESSNSSSYVVFQYDDFSTSDISITVSMGDSYTTDYSGTYAIYDEDFLYVDGLSLHFMVPGSTGSMASPGPEWLVLKIQKESMKPGVYTLDNSDQNYQLSAPGQVKLYYKDVDNVIHCGTGSLMINTLEWYNSGNNTARLTIDIEFQNITLDGGQSDLGMSRSAGQTGTTTGSFTGVASISESTDSTSLTGTTWRGTYYYGSIPVVEYLNFTSSTSCTGRTEAGGDSLTTYMTYTYNPDTQTGTLTADSTAPFSIDGNTLTFNGTEYIKQ